MAHGGSTVNQYYYNACKLYQTQNLHENEDTVNTGATVLGVTFNRDKAK